MARLITTRFFAQAGRGKLWIVGNEQELVVSESISRSLVPSSASDEGKTCSASTTP